MKITIAAHNEGYYFKGHDGVEIWLPEAMCNSECVRFIQKHLTLKPNV